MFEHVIAYFIVTANKTSIFMQPYVSSDRMCFLGSGIEVSLRNNNCNSHRDKKIKLYKSVLSKTLLMQILDYLKNMEIAASLTIYVFYH